MVNTPLRILAGTLVGGLLGTLAGAFLVSQRCAAPACAGLIVVPMITGCAGLVAGLVVTLGWVLDATGVPQGVRAWGGK